MQPNLILVTAAGWHEIDLTAQRVRLVDEKQTPLSDEAGEWRDYTAISNVSHNSRAVIVWADEATITVTLPIEKLIAKAVA